MPEFTSPAIGLVLSELDLIVGQGRKVDWIVEPAICCLWAGFVRRNRKVRGTRLVLLPKDLDIALPVVETRFEYI